jgi:hypothetical protein
VSIHTPQTIELKTKKNKKKPNEKKPTKMTTTYGIGNPGPGLSQVILKYQVHNLL